MKIKFLEACAVKTADGSIKRSYEKGKEYYVDESSARHWIVRRKAVAVNGEIASPPAPPAPPSDLSDKAEKRHGERLKAVSTSAEMKGKSPNEAFA